MAASNHGPGSLVGTTLTSPAGTPASDISSARKSAVSGVSAGGLMTVALPAPSAGATLRVIIAAGKFHGVTITTTPTGGWVTMTRLAPDGRRPEPAGDADRLLGVPPEELGGVVDLTARFGERLALLGRDAARPAHRRARASAASTHEGSRSARAADAPPRMAAPRRPPPPRRLRQRASLRRRRRSARRWRGRGRRSWRRSAPARHSPPMYNCVLTGATEASRTGRAIGPRCDVFGENWYVVGTSSRVGSAPRQDLQEDPQLESGERSAEAVVGTEAERQVVARVRPVEVESLAVGEVLGVAVGRPEQHEQLRCPPGRRRRTARHRTRARRRHATTLQS